MVWDETLSRVWAFTHARHALLRLFEDLLFEFQPCLIWFNLGSAKTLDRFLRVRAHAQLELLPLQDCRVGCRVSISGRKGWCRTLKRRGNFLASWGSCFALSKRS